jgi:hypothetical protein
MAFALAWIAASGEVHAAKKDKSMCDGLTGAAKGFCTAAAALGCGAPTKHQKQCDALGDKFEALTHTVPPWEKPVDPPPPDGAMKYDTDGFDLETATLCALGAECNLSDTDAFHQPSDFSMSLDENQTIFFPVLECIFANVGVSRVTGVAYADVNFSTLDLFPLEEGIAAVDFAPGDTIVLRTCEGNHFKIGNLVVGTSDSGPMFSFGPL